MKKPKHKILITDLFEDALGQVMDLNIRRYNLNGTPLCIVEGCDCSAHNKGKNHGGYQLYCKYHLGIDSKDEYRYYKYEVPYCENIDGRLGYICTYTVPHICTLGVDHINEVHDDNRRENLQTLCASCHGYKTFKYRGLPEEEILRILAENTKKFMMQV